MDDTARLRSQALQRITGRRAEILRELADGYSEREVAGRLGIELSTVRSHTEDLREITGSASLRDLGRWWRAHRTQWLDLLREQAGIGPPDT